MKTISLLCLLCFGMSSYAQISIWQLFGATGLQKEVQQGIRSVNEKTLSFLQKKYSRLNAAIEK